MLKVSRALLCLVQEGAPLETPAGKGGAAAGQELSSSPHTPAGHDSPVSFARVAIEASLEMAQSMYSHGTGCAMGGMHATQLWMPLGAAGAHGLKHIH